MPNLSLDLSEATELAELLQFPRDRPTTDHEHLDASLIRFVGHPSYNANQQRLDLNRFTFLLGGNDGEPLFNPDPQ
jgi:hypothetical protein